MTTFDKITRLLDSRAVSFEVIEHPAEGRSDAISKIRGNKLSQAAKAMVLQVTGSTPDIRYVLAIVPGDCKVNFKNAAKLAGGKKASFAAPETAQTLTGCPMGAVPPFSFNDELTLYVDKRLTGAGRVFFNAGELVRSVSLAADDYFSVIGHDRIADIAVPPAAE
ncbi:YbaK/EbsC family protein [Morganella morganii]|uniref:YbaK/EbsC family protein n=1 Tax=Morganella morganii TaxID=582 RepID=UPI001BD1ED05|nr:YbaK/EbsC family protein [Morganella morganii]MBS9584331.1 YbaK/prolyl-tRNA synthetase associated domain-containing protein [Morganella morganii subsp. morganii]QWL86747.1 YbaK/prolyl-tRNA synthetase associated domain-containing protein [Morganella morganii subsp. morganii]